jgi:hypothetical protein
MAYKVKKGKEGFRFGGAIKDGREKINILLGEATEEQLEELYAILPHLITKTTKGKPKKKKRDNDKGAPLPKLEDE